MTNENTKPDSFATDGESARNENSLKITSKGHVYDDWSDRLKPCPRCGKDAFMFFNSLAHGNRYYVGCTDGDCKMQLQPYQFKMPDEAAEHWNTRVNNCFDCSFGAISLDKLTEEQKEHIRPFVERTCEYVPDATLTYWDDNDNEIETNKPDPYECCAFECTECGFEMLFGDDGWFDEEEPWEPHFKYCPNCSAKVISTEYYEKVVGDVK